MSGNSLLSHVPRLLELIRELLPFGTRANETKPESEVANWDLVPLWPPDLFAVAATLVDRSGCYAYPFPRFCHPHDTNVMLTTSERAALMQCYGARWRGASTVRSVALPAGLDVSFKATITRLQERWTTLIKPHHTLTDLCTDGDAEGLRAAALELMWIADEASAGIATRTRTSSRFAREYARLRLAVSAEKLPEEALQSQAPPDVHLQTACRLVPAKRICVQPKMRTPQVGCTIRSMSHHLALLPGASEVMTVWRMYPGRLDITRRVLNVLLVPYPYTIKGEAISAHETAAAAGRSMRDGSGADMHERDGRACWFNVALQDPPALPSGTACMEEWILGLVEAAKAETKQLHGVVLPEGALSLATAQRVADRLIGTGIDFFISGIGDSTEHDKPRNNRIYGRMYWTDDDQQSHSRTWLQGKHHRWRLESNQICQYHLGHALHPSNVWWEHIELGARKVELQGGVGGGALTALICEDLARIDPVQTVLRSTGPNLVFALLMDGPQLPQRWSARYATVLADDPGSSVITLTSLGMVKRSFAPGDNERLCVGLWKDSSGTTRELLLPQEHHALLLSLTRHRVEQFTLDGRSDGKSTAQLSLGGVHALKWQKPKPSEQPASAEAPRTQAPPAHRSPQSSRGAASPGWTYEKYARAAHGIAYRVAYPNNAKVCEAGSGVGLTRECVDDAREHAPITSGE